MMQALLTALLLLAAGGAAAACAPAAPCAVAGGSYVALVPEGPARGAILFLHGYRGTGAAVLRDAGLGEMALARGYVLLAADGAPVEPGRPGGRWNAAGLPAARDDVAFLVRVADDAAARFGFPRGRVLAAGFSGGGMMVWRLACDAPAAFAAYAPVAGLLWRPLPEACKGPVRLRHTHGWSDRVVPLEGRGVAGGRITQGDLFAGLDLLRKALGCRQDAPDEVGRDGDTLTRSWLACAAGGELVLSIHLGGHRMPPGWIVRTLDWFETEPAAGR